MFLGYVLDREHLGKIKAFVKFLKDRKRDFYLAGSFMLFSLLLTLPMPWVSMKVVDEALAARDARLFFVLVAAWAVIILLKTLTTFMQSYFLNNFQLYSVLSLRARIFHHLLRVPLSYYSDKQTGYLITRVSQDVEDAVSILGNSSLNVMQSLLSLVFGISLIFLINGVLAAIALAVVPFYLISQRLFNFKIRKVNNARKEEWSKVGGFLQEILSGVLSVKVYNRENFEIERFNDKSVTAIQLTVRNWLLSAYAGSVNGFIQSLSPVVILSIAGYFIMNGKMTTGELVGFIGYLSLLYGPSTQLFGYFTNLQSAVVSVDRIFDILKQPDESNGVSGIDATDFKGEIRFQDVNFHYEKEKSNFKIEDLSLQIKPGERIGLVGRTGSGKTTIAYLLMRLYDPDSGDIYLDGKEIREYALTDLRKLVGIVPQETYIFSGTIAENIKYANLEASDEEMYAAAKASYAHNFISNLPDGYDTIIGERGFQLSGGQKQMISIARVFLLNPKILLLDEATSSVDLQSESLIKKATAEIMKNKTSIIISHRLTSLTNVDRIVLIDNGKVVVVGSHDELYSFNRQYTELYEGSLS